VKLEDLTKNTKSLPSNMLRNKVVLSACVETMGNKARILGVLIEIHDSGYKI
jgi:hypothetical protein